MRWKEICAKDCVNVVTSYKRFAQVSYPCDISLIKSKPRSNNELNYKLIKASLSPSIILTFNYVIFYIYAQLYVVNYTSARI